MELNWLSLVLRWTHILAASTAIGGTVFVLLALQPAMKGLSGEPRQALQREMHNRWSKVVMAVIALLLISGLWNYFLNREMFLAAGLKLSRMYNITFGIKFLLALAAFALSSILAGHSQGTENIRRNGRFWTSVNLAILVLIVVLSGVLRSSHTAPNAHAADAPPIAAPHA